tara:strand:- start:415 stop:1068 length:654 start_codon:yes stop_codon:yes gene_type:complete
MTYKVYAIGGLSIIALIVALAYNPVPSIQETEYDFKNIISTQLELNNKQFIKDTITKSSEWNSLETKIKNADESKDVSSLDDSQEVLENRVNQQSKTIVSLDKRIKLLETKQVTSTNSGNGDEIVTFYLSDGEREEDRFNQGDIVYFYATVDSNANYLYYEIWDDDRNVEIKDRRIEVRDNTVLAWAWSIPTTQATGDYYIEIDLGDDNQKIFFDVK